MGTPTITFLYNNSANNTPNTGEEAGDTNWAILNPINDKLAFLGADTDNDDLTTSKSVAIIPGVGSGPREAPKIFINKYIESKWKRIWLGGSNANEGGGGNYRYAMGFYIDGTTTSAPILQAWDSTAHVNAQLEVLGSGTPANSMIRAVSTTDTTAGDQWAGTPIAGDGFANTITLNSTALGAPQMVYFNVRLLIPETATPFAEGPCLCLYLTYS